MSLQLRIEGIYDQRTLKHLKQIGLKDFSFDFSPKSFNFVQEYVFLEQFLKILESDDRVFLHFARSDDPMVFKLIEDLKKAGHSLKNVYFEFDLWSKDLSVNNFKENYLIHYSKENDLTNLLGPSFKGFIFESHFFEELHQKNVLSAFATNFYTKYFNKLNDDSLLLLRVDWHDNLLHSIFELFDFNLLSFPINSHMEVCYRNVDLKKLSTEMELLQKKSLLFKDLKDFR